MCVGVCKTYRFYLLSPHPVILAPTPMVFMDVANAILYHIVLVMNKVKKNKVKQSLSKADL